MIERHYGTLLDGAMESIAAPARRARRGAEYEAAEGRLGPLPPVV